MQIDIRITITIASYHCDCNSHLSIIDYLLCSTLQVLPDNLKPRIAPHCMVLPPGELRGDPRATARLI